MKIIITLFFLTSVIELYSDQNSHQLIPHEEQHAKEGNSIIIPSLAKSIKDGIKLLEAGKNVEFMNRFLNPKDKEKLLKGTTLEEFNEKIFKKKSASGILAILKEIIDGKPILKKNGTIAQFKVDKKLTKTKKDTTITFTRIEGKWYLNRH